MSNPFTAGDILVGSWGYEQTNVDFYEVVRVTPCTVRYVSIGQKYAEQLSSMSARVVPDTARKGTREHVSRLTKGRPDALNSPSGQALLTRWDGSPKFASSWG